MVLEHLFHLARALQDVPKVSLDRQRVIRAVVFDLEA